MLVREHKEQYKAEMLIFQGLEAIQQVILPLHFPGKSYEQKRKNA